MLAANQPLLIGRPLPAVAELVGHLGAEHLSVPDVAGAGGSDSAWSSRVTAWGHDLRRGRRARHVAVCTWRPDSEPEDLADQSIERWNAGVEAELGLWFAATVSAAHRCVDGGVLVIVAERPAPLDSSGHAATVAVAEGLSTLGRSLGICEGDRGVRVVTIFTAVATAPTTLLGLSPLLGTFPGRVESEVAGAVRAVWSDDAVGITGSVVRADCGRSW